MAEHLPFKQGVDGSIPSTLTKLLESQQISRLLTLYLALSAFQFSKTSLEAVRFAFGDNVEYATLKKLYHGDGIGREGYSPAALKGVRTSTIIGKPDREKICTSYVERHNLTIRMQLRRFARLTNAASKKAENLKAAMALYFYHYNFMRYHSSLKMTPAMKAGITTQIWTWEPVLD